MYLVRILVRFGRYVHIFTYKYLLEAFIELAQTLAISTYLKDSQNFYLSLGKGEVSGSSPDEGIAQTAVATRLYKISESGQNIIYY